VVLNLVVNAVQASRQGDVVQVATSARDGQVLLAIEDKGCGMTPETVRKMFDPYFTTKPQRRGLGLAASGEIVRRHGGALQVRSASGVGTTIRVLLPLPADLGGPPRDPACFE